MKRMWVRLDISSWMAYFYPLSPEDAGKRLMKILCALGSWKRGVDELADWAMDESERYSASRRNGATARWAAKQDDGADAHAMHMQSTCNPYAMQNNAHAMHCIANTERNGTDGTDVTVRPTNGQNRRFKPTDGPTDAHARTATPASHAKQSVSDRGTKVPVNSLKTVSESGNVVCSISGDAVESSVGVTYTPEGVGVSNASESILGGNDDGDLYATVFSLSNDSIPRWTARFCREDDLLRATRAFACQLRRVGDEAFRSTLAAFAGECAAGEEPRNRGSALMARLKILETSKK